MFCNSMPLEGTRAPCFLPTYFPHPHPKFCNPDIWQVEAESSRSSFPCSKFETHWPTDTHTHITLSVSTVILWTKSNFLLVQDKVSLCNTTGPETHCADQAGLKLTKGPTCLYSQVLRLKVCTTMPGFQSSVYQGIINEQHNTWSDQLGQVITAFHNLSEFLSSSLFLPHLHKELHSQSKHIPHSQRAPNLLFIHLYLSCHIQLYPNFFKCCFFYRDFPQFSIKQGLLTDHGCSHL